MRTTKAFLLSALVACGGASATQPATTPAPVTPDPIAKPMPPAATPRPASDNPGGMWLPEQLLAHADTLRALGLAVDPAALADSSRAPLGAIINLNGCSAAFVSADGLIATNHHCIQGALQYTSTPEQNLIEDGYLARTRADERWAGPTARVRVELGVRDVTAEMTTGLAEIADDRARALEIEKREKAVLAACEKDRPGLRCHLGELYAGAEWRLYERLELRDVRLVYAPPRGVGNFGGQVDNWRWPRHTGDFGFLRAYTAPDGTPADHSAANVPYRPKHHLKVATRPLGEGDLVVVAGYPGKTQRLAPSWRVAETATWLYPRRLLLYTELLAAIDAVTASDESLAIKAEPKKRGLGNYLQKHKGELATLVGGGMLEERQQQDEALVAWIDADDARRAKYAAAVKRYRELDAARTATREADAHHADLIAGSLLFEAALKIVRQAEERGKPDAERKTGFQERDALKNEQDLAALDKKYARALDRAMFRVVLVRAAAAADGDRPAILGLVLGGGGKKRDAKAIDAALDRLYGKTTLERAETRVALFKTATIASLRKSKDPFIQLALATLPEVKRLEAETEAHRGAVALVAPLYVAARRELRDAPLAPDANGTLRVTFGTVQGPAGGGPSFTTVAEMVAKATGEAPFHAPADVLAAARTGDFGPYADAALDDLPLAYMSDLDITNGNSGSSTLNARGEWIGLAFDGTLDTVASDWLYLRGKARSIHVDVRYILWMMDAVDDADHLLVEMGLTPKL